MKDLDILIAEKHEAVRKIENADNNIDKLHHFGTYLNILSQIEILTGQDLLKDTLIDCERKGDLENYD